MSKRWRDVWQISKRFSDRNMANPNQRHWWDQSVFWLLKSLLSPANCVLHAAPWKRIVLHHGHLATRQIHAVKLFSQSVSADLCKRAGLCPNICSHQTVRRSLQMCEYACWTLCKYLLTLNCAPICAKFFQMNLCSANLSVWKYLCLPICFCRTQLSKICFCKTFSRWRWEAGGFPANLPYFFPISSLQPPLWDHFFSFLFCGSTFFILLIKFMLTSNRYQSSLSVFSAANWTDFCLFCPFCVDHHHP